MLAVVALAAGSRLLNLEWLYAAGLILIAALGAPVAIVVDAASFLASIGGLLLVRAREPITLGSIPKQHVVAEVVEGWRVLMTNPVLRAVAATAFTANFFYRVIMSAYVLYLTRSIGLSPAAVGAIFGLGGGLGVLIGSASASAVASKIGIGRTMLVTHALFGVLGLPLAGTTLVPEWGAPLAFSSEFLQLAVNAVYMVNRTSVEQALSPERVRGRIQASRTVLHAIAGALGLLVGGTVGEQFGPGAAIASGVLGGTTSFLWLWLSPLPRLQIQAARPLVHDRSADSGLSSAQLARRAFVTPQTMNRNVANLETAGLIQRDPHPELGRVLETTLTRRGQRRLSECQRRIDDVEARMVTDLTVSERRQLGKLRERCTRASRPARQRGSRQPRDGQRPPARPQSASASIIDSERKERNV